MKLIEEYKVSEVRALSYKLPFAWLMFHGKTYETRSWNTNYRGWVLICASKMPYKQTDLLATSGATQEDRIKKLIKSQEEDIGIYAGQAIGVGFLSNSFPMGTTDVEKSFVKFNRHLYIHEYTNLHLIKPFKWAGTQGWKTLDQETINKIELL